MSFVTTTLTEHRLVAQALARINRATTLGVLGASIAHELNQPLGAIVAERPRRLAVGSSREGPNTVRVEVSDSGPGVDPSQADRLFEAFYTTQGEGIGMGLSISSAIVEAHGGLLWVGPNEPRGAAFCVSLPIEAAA